MTGKILLVGAAGLSLTACMTASGGADPSAASAPAQNFVCDRSDSARIAFASDKAMLTAGGTTATLAQQPSGSGFLYSGEGHEIRGKGPELT